MSTIAHSLVEVDDHGVAWIKGSRVKVIEIVLDLMAHGSSPEEIHFQHPHLSLAQIHAALSYYYDHQSELDDEIEQRWQKTNELAAREANSPLQRRLRNLKNRR